MSFHICGNLGGIGGFKLPIRNMPTPLLSLTQDMGASTPAGRKAPSSSFNSLWEYGRAFTQTPERFWNRALAVTTPSEEMTEVLLFLHTSSQFLPNIWLKLRRSPLLSSGRTHFKLNCLEGHYFYREHLPVSSLNSHVLNGFCIGPGLQ